MLLINYLPKKNLNLNANSHFLIANDSPSTSTGTHWLAFFLTRKSNENNIEYFDSYKNKFIESFLKRFGDKIIFNKAMLQSPFLTKCWKYCICFLHHKSTNKSMTSFVKLFFGNLSENDKKNENIYIEIRKHGIINQTGGSCKISRKCVQSCCSLLESN